MRVGQVAARLDVSVSLVYGLLTTGKLRGTRHGLKRGTWRVSEDQLAEYLSLVSDQPEELKHIKVR